MPSSHVALLLAALATQDPTHAQDHGEDAVAPAGAPWWEIAGVTGTWGGARTRLEQLGITIAGSYTWEGAVSLDGGLREDESWLGLVDLNGSFDLDALFGWSGATVYFDAYSLRNENPSDYVGDAQGVSNLATSRDLDQVGELWLEQLFDDGALRVKLGKIDAYEEFQYASAAREFLNLGMDFGLTDVGQPSYPDPAGGALAFWYPAERMHVAAGVFDGAAHTGVQTGSRPIDTFLGAPSDLYGIAEFSQGWSVGFAELAGRIKVGAWHHSGTFDRFDGGTEDGTTGCYLTFEQEVSRERDAHADDPQSRELFVHVGWADPDVSEANWHTSAGFTWTGAIAGRDADVVGVGVSRVEWTEEDGAGFTTDGELAVESFYRCQVTPWISLKPDLQYVHDPGGDASIEDAWIALLRVELVF